VRLTPKWLLVYVFGLAVIGTTGLWLVKMASSPPRPGVHERYV
jgi:hypothetical protein